MVSRPKSLSKNLLCRRKRASQAGAKEREGGILSNNLPTERNAVTGRHRRLQPKRGFRIGSKTTLVGLSVLLLLGAAAPVSAAAFKSGDKYTCAAAILMEAETGTILFEHNPQLQVSPASTLKLLLQLVVLDLVRQGKASLDEPVWISTLASQVGGSQVFLKAGEVFPLRKLMEAATIASANDACVAVAEHLGGSVENFVGMMNERARQLGLKHTYCVNVNGLDDTPEENRNLTTAFDLAQIARALLAYPEALEWSSATEKPFRSERSILHNTNKLLGNFKGMDGLKTGYTARARFCLVGTAQRQNMRLISVVLGAPNRKTRERETCRLLNWGFDNYTQAPVARAGESMGPVFLSGGKEPQVNTIVRNTVVAILSSHQQKQLQHELLLPERHPAPVTAGEELGKLRISLGDSLVAEVSIVAAKSVGRMGLWERLVSIF